jgi:hypothetical protein
MKITLQLKPGINRRLSTNIDLTDVWTKIEILKSSSLFAPEYYISFALPENVFLRKEFVQAQSLLFILSNTFGNIVSEEKIIELQITNVAHSQLGYMGLMGEPDLLRTMVTVTASPIQARASRDIIGGSFLTNPNAQSVLNFVLGGLGVDVATPLPVTFTQVLIPTTYRIDAFSYLCASKGIYDSPAFYTHESDGIHVLTVKDSLSRPGRYKIIYGMTKTESSKLDANTLLTSRVIVSPNDAFIQYQTPSTLNTSVYTHNDFALKHVETISSVPFSPFGQFLPSPTPSKRISGETTIITGSSSGNALHAKYSYELLNNLTLTVLIDIPGKFQDLRPGMAIDFESDIDPAHAGLNGTYIIKEVQAKFEKKGQEIVRDLRIVIQRYGIEYR